MSQDEEMLERLQEIAQADYADILKTADFSPEKVEETAMKITVCKAFLDSIGDFEPGFPNETAAFLFYKKPITKLYEEFINGRYSLPELLAEPLSDLTVGLKYEVRTAIEQTVYKPEQDDDLER